MEHEFDTVMEMKKRMNRPWYRHHWFPWGWPKLVIDEGDTIDVEGYLAKGDGGCTTYEVIKPTGEEDGGAYIELTPYQCSPLFEVDLDWHERVDLLSTEEGHECWENAIDKELDK